MPKTRPKTFQELILALERFWADRGCLIQQPYDLEVGAGTMNPATTLRSLGPEPWNVAYVAALPKAHRRTVRGEPQQAPALLPVPGDFKTLAHRRAGPVPEEPASAGHRSAGARHPVRGGRLGVPHPRCLAGHRLGGLASTAWRSPSSPISNMAGSIELSSPSPWNSPTAWKESPCICRAWTTSTT